MITKQRSIRITLEATDSSVLGYVYLQKAAPAGVARTAPIKPGVFADYDSQGILVGVEFLAAEKADQAVMHDLATRLHVQELAGIDLAEMCKTFK